LRQTPKSSYEKQAVMADNPLILAVETSSRVGSVALATGERLCAEITFSGPMKHSAEIFPSIITLMERFTRKPHEIEHIYLSIGPGSFTGLRIATTIAKALHLAQGTKIVPVGTLDVIAANVTDCAEQNEAATPSHRQASKASVDRIATILDAKRGQFYVAAYERTTQSRAIRNAQYAIEDAQGSVWRKTQADCLMTAAQFLESFAGADRPIWLLGDGLLYHKDKFKADGVHFLDDKYWSPRAGKVHLLGRQKAAAGQFADPLTLTPKYLMRPDIKLSNRFHR
jgi:tRNA threonylcarbamoyladenosine biosynthesis protein TsaB